MICVVRRLPRSNDPSSHAAAAAYFIPGVLPQLLQLTHMFVLSENLRSKKRRRDSFESLPEDSAGDWPSVKRKKRTSEAGAYSGHRPPSFWNRLSKVHLTRGALREFDRRTSRIEQQLFTPTSSIDDSSGSGTKNLKQFSRRGGPDLAHIRGVKFNSSVPTNPTLTE
jgi:hypothetical protein